MQYGVGRQPCMLPSSSAARAARLLGVWGTLVAEAELGARARAGGPRARTSSTSAPTYVGIGLCLTLHNMGEIYPHDTIEIVRREHKA